MARIARPAFPEWLTPNFAPIAALLIHLTGVLRTQALGGAIGSQRMSPTRYFLVQHDDAWMIKFADEEFGPYKSKSEAMLFAVEGRLSYRKFPGALENSYFSPRTSWQPRRKPG